MTLACAVALGFVSAAACNPSTTGGGRDGKPPMLRKNGDADGDGVPDLHDECPTVSGARPGGCPAEKVARPEVNQADIDRDGFIDIRDACPTMPGVEPHGCPAPEVDTDGDGIADSRDKCANESEVYNGHKDSDGCADKVSGRVTQKLTRGLSEEKGIRFVPNSGTLTPASVEALRRVAVLIVEAPGCPVFVTADAGRAAQRAEVARQRADLVIKELIKLSVPPDQLQPKDPSELDPVPLMAADSVVFRAVSGCR